MSKKEKQEYLQLQLANMPEARRELADQKRLEELEAHYINIKSQFTDAYPDVIKVKDEIAEFHLLKKSKITTQKCISRNDNITLEIEVDFLVSFEPVMNL